MADVAICIKTHRQTFALRRVLKALGNLETVHRITIVVGDTASDDAVGSGLGICRQVMQAGYRWSIIPVPLAHRNTARVRNAMLAAAFEAGAPVFVAFLDDRTVPETGWLDALVTEQRSTHADVVFGPTVAAFETTAPKWVAKSGFFDRATPPDAWSDATVRLDNVLFKASVFGFERKPWFDPREAVVGLSDSLFVARSRLEGADFQWAERARASRLVPADEISAHRMCRTAHDAARIALTTRRIVNRHAETVAGEAWRVLKTLTLGAVIYTALGWHPGGRFSGERRIWSALGRLAALRGPISLPLRPEKPGVARPVS